jgi:tetratricopeptide (TPR) repeat protein
MKGRVALLGILTVFTATSIWACVNTSYSRDEEVQITEELIYLILGAFPAHSDHFYNDQVTKNTKALKADPTNVVARNDLAVAYLKLKQFDKAQAEFDTIDAQDKDRYTTHANLGVMYKKMGQYEKAAHHIGRSLEIKTEGHLGLGDYYLRMLKWRQTSNPTENFLGVPYADGAEATVKSPLVNKEYLATLIKADRHFSDVYLVLGDVLFVEKKYQLAMRAYVQAEILNPEDPAKVWERMHRIESIWETQKKKGQIVEDAYHVYSIVRDEIGQAEKWVEDFKELEVSLMKSDLPASFDDIRDTLSANNIDKPVFNKFGLVKGKLVTYGSGGPLDLLEDLWYALTSPLAIMALVGIIVVVVFVLYLFYRSTRTA